MNPCLFQTGYRIARLVCTLVLASLSLHAMAGVDLVAYTEDLPPLSIPDGEKVSGFSGELLDLMAKEAGLTIRQRVLPWARAYALVQQTPDTVLFSTVRSPERDAQFLWVGPILPRHIYLYRLASHTGLRIRTPDQLANYRVSTLFESASARQLQALGLKPQGNLDISHSDRNNLLKLAMERTDLVSMLDVAMLWHLQKLGWPRTTVQPVATLDSGKQYWFAVNRTTQAQKVKKLQQALATLAANGKLAALRRSYFGEDLPRPSLPDFTGLPR